MARFQLELGLYSTDDNYTNDINYANDIKISFKLNSDISIKSIKFHGLITEQNGDIPADDKLCKADADFTLYSAELSLLLVDLIAAVE